MALRTLGYVTNWVHTFNEGTLTNIAVSAWRLLTESEQLKGRIDPNRHRRALTTLNAKIRWKRPRSLEASREVENRSQPSFNHDLNAP